ncbi:histidine kinase [Solirubrobacter phytolaccae]|uniref:histidine kinase n=1 Tax=Solirubrobacter phytolaccae TaxID=1404360 RepID=A0A9X3NEX7_9ACTN|nr:histidine kinase [Solirubrobacter phytolaccae]MDA0183727.1 histidine kinase [Solirubrobacter phytolaccae]
MLPLRWNAIGVLVAITVASVMLPFLALLALVPLYWLAADRGLRWAVAGAALMVAAQLVSLNHWLEPVSTAVLAAATVTAARFTTMRRELLASNAAAEERLRIARELHDAVGHDVTLMVVQAEALAAVTGDERADAIAAQGRRTMAELHRVLRDDDPERKGLDALEEILDGARGAGIPITLAIEGTPRTLAKGLDASAYRIVQEAVTNVIRHANGAPTTVTIDYGQEQLGLRVADAGGRSIGMSHGHGLIGISERVSAFGGSLVVKEGQEGFVVSAELPYT